jgi:hypothetical protein
MTAAVIRVKTVAAKDNPDYKDEILTSKTTNFDKEMQTRQRVTIPTSSKHRESFF